MSYLKSRWREISRPLFFMIVRSISSFFILSRKTYIRPFSPFFRPFAEKKSFSLTFSFLIRPGLQKEFALSLTKAMVRESKVWNLYAWGEFVCALVCISVSVVTSIGVFFEEKKYQKKDCFLLIYFYQKWMLPVDAKTERIIDKQYDPFKYGTV